VNPSPPKFKASAKLSGGSYSATTRGTAQNIAVNLC